MALSVTILQNKCTSKTETNRFQVVLICCLLTERLALCGGCSHLITLPRHLFFTCVESQRGPGWQIHGSVEDTKLSTNKQHTLSLIPPSFPPHFERQH